MRGEWQQVRSRPTHAAAAAAAAPDAAVAGGDS